MIVNQIATINQGATKFKALVLYIEHRFYGESTPLRNIGITLEDIEVRGCFTSAQTLINCAKLIQDIKKKFPQKNAPVIVLGCSYSGINIMLATWFRLKFPHIATGALASSAPAFTLTWTKHGITKMIDNIGSQGAAGHAYLNKIFKTCSPLISVKALNTDLVSFLCSKAQYNGRYNGKINNVYDEIVRALEDNIIRAINFNR
ncbi:Lysosomal Pro-X carboxypeptidase [Bienertia sinuspersici]